MLHLLIVIKKFNLKLSQAQMTDGSLACGRWVRGKREGKGTLISPRLEARGIAMIQVLSIEQRSLILDPLSSLEWRTPSDV